MFHGICVFQCLDCVYLWTVCTFPCVWINDGSLDSIGVFSRDPQHYMHSGLRAPDDSLLQTNSDSSHINYSPRPLPPWFFFFFLNVTSRQTALNIENRSFLLIPPAWVSFEGICSPQPWFWKEKKLLLSFIYQNCNYLSFCENLLYFSFFFVNIQCGSFFFCFILLQLPMLTGSSCRLFIGNIKITDVRKRRFNLYVTFCMILYHWCPSMCMSVTPNHTGDPFRGYPNSSWIGSSYPEESPDWPFETIPLRLHPRNNPLKMKRHKLGFHFFIRNPSTQQEVTGVKGVEGEEQSFRCFFWTDSKHAFKAKLFIAKYRFLEEEKSANHHTCEYGMTEEPGIQK